MSLHPVTIYMDGSIGLKITKSSAFAGIMAA